MTAPTSTATTEQFPADVLALAARYDNAAYLQPLLEATRRLFPTARSLRVFTEKDPELRDVEFLVFEVEVPSADLPDYRAADKRWDAEYCRIVPRPHNCPFVFSLIPVD